MAKINFIFNFCSIDTEAFVKYFLIINIILFSLNLSFIINFIYFVITLIIFIIFIKNRNKTSKSLKVYCIFNFIRLIIEFLINFNEFFNNIYLLPWILISIWLISLNLKLFYITFDKIKYPKVNNSNNIIMSNKESENTLDITQITNDQVQVNNQKQFKTQKFDKSELQVINKD